MLSENRQSHWIYLIVNGLLEKNCLVYKDKDLAMRAAQRAMRFFMEQHQKIEQKVREKINSLKRTVPENSQEWEVLYSRYYEDELSRSALRE